MATTKLTVLADDENRGLEVAAKQYGGGTKRRAPLGFLSANVGRDPSGKKKKIMAQPTQRRGIERQQPRARKALKEVSCMEVDLAAPESASQESATTCLPPNVTDIDAEDVGVPCMASEYVQDAYDYMRSIEWKYRVNPIHLQRQSHYNEMVRSILINWIVDVQVRLELLQETLFLTINLMDRYLCKTTEVVPKNQLQLVAITSLLVASKYEEIHPPQVDDLIYLTENSYSRDQIFHMEEHLLEVLEFNLGTPLPIHFLRRDSKAGGCSTRMHIIGKYLIEMTLGSYQMLSYAPSMIAASSLYIARDILHMEVWNETITHYSGYTEEDVQQCVEGIRGILREAPTSQHQAVRNKYGRSRLNRVSRMPEWELYLK